MNIISEKLESYPHIENLMNPKLDPLLRPFRRHLVLALNVYACSGGNQLAERRHGGVNNDLDFGGTRSVVKLQERERAHAFLVAGLNPPSDPHFLASQAGFTVGATDDVTDQDALRELRLLDGVESADIVISENEVSSGRDLENFRTQKRIEKP
ncbi:hypothetical protein U1Q18_011844 [Sarracenia purpurea var. burkii]